VGPGDAAGSGFSEPLGATDDPPLPKLIEGRRYLDYLPGTTVAELKERIRNCEVEIGAISADGETIEFAPIIGEQTEISLEGVGQLLTNKHLIHNHPEVRNLSGADLSFAIVNDLKSIAAVLRDGSEVRLERVGPNWPPVGLALRAHRTGKHRAASLASKSLSRRRLLEISVREVNRAFRAAFGPDTIQIVLQ